MSSPAPWSTLAAMSRTLAARVGIALIALAALVALVLAASASAATSNIFTVAGIGTPIRIRFSCPVSRLSTAENWPVTPIAPRTASGSRARSWPATRSSPPSSTTWSPKDLRRPVAAIADRERVMRLLLPDVLLSACQGRRTTTLPAVVRARTSTVSADESGASEASSSLRTLPAAARTSSQAAVPSRIPISRSPSEVSSTTEPRTT
jgi:hypothetical protein